MNIFKRRKEIAESDNHPTEKPIKSETCIEQKECAISKIVNGKLYTTSTAKKICSVIVPEDEIPDCKLWFRTLGGQEVTIYKGRVEYFITYYCYLIPVSEEWVKKWIGAQDIDKYIELFGEPELA